MRDASDYRYSLDLADERAEELETEIERLRAALEPFADENAWSGWNDHKGAYLTASFRGLGQPWVWAQDALNQSSVSAPGDDDEC